MVSQTELSQHVYELYIHKLLTYLFSCLRLVTTWSREPLGPSGLPTVSTHPPCTFLSSSLRSVTTFST